METQGRLAPETETTAREEYAALADAAQTVTRAVARALDAGDRLRRAGTDTDSDSETARIVATAHDALFASLLAVHVGTAGEFESWVDDTGLDPDVVGSENVDRVAWHPVPFVGRVAAATFQSEPDAAVATLRRRAFGEYYRPVVREGSDGSDGGDSRDTAGGDAA